MSMHTRYAVPLTAMAAAMLSAFGPAPARAADDEVAELTTPQSELSVGGGYVFEDNQRFGQFTGLRDKGLYGLLDFNLVKRFNDTGTWIRFFGRNVGFDDRELRLGVEQQGNWRFFVDFSQTPNFIPYTVTTGLFGIGTPNQTINGAGFASYDLETKRDTWTLGFGKNLPAGFDFQVRYQNQKKEGSRLWGQGTFGTINFLADPIDYDTDQLEATLGYTGERLQLLGGYYGTWFKNSNLALNVTGGVPGLSPMALPPGNESWQAFLGGGYNFTPTTRGNFKVAYTHQTQDQGFIVASPTGRANLGGDVDTTLAQLGIVSRPIPKLTLNADLRYVDRKDKTPIAQYIPPPTVAAPGTYDGTNEPRSLEQWFGKVEASYQLPMAFRLIGAIDYQSIERNAYAVRSVSFRSKTEETSYRAEVRRSFAEQVTGALAYIYSQRDGSSFLFNQLYGTPPPTFTPGSNNIAPLHLADRDRNRLRFSLNWTPLEPLSVQFFADVAKDSYGTRASGLGLQDGKFQNYSVDATYVFSPDWQLSAWYSYNSTTAEQSTCQAAAAAGGVCPASAANPIWQANLSNTTNAVGFGLRGKPWSRIEIGVDLQYQTLVDQYDQFPLVPSTSAAVGPIPDINTKLTTVKLWGKYALDKNSGIRVDYIYDRFDTNDWTWTTWVYSDGTVVSQQPLQTVNFLGVSYYYRFQ
ncbi:MAG: MtrB/PioB family decaheme-associated outer membrane protein [Burkholderiales bacterium]